MSVVIVPNLLLLEVAGAHLPNVHIATPLALRVLHLTMSLLAEARPSERSFNPYTENGGTILAIAGADFSVVAGDTRQSEGFNIQTRYAPKVFRLYVSLRCIGGIHRLMV